MIRIVLAALAVCLFVAFAPPVAAKSPGQALIVATHQDLGTNPTGWKRLWCAQYLRVVLKELGFKRAYKKTNATAKSFLKLPRTKAKPGAIAVMGRKGGGHVCVVVRVLKSKFECIGGNQGRKIHGKRKVSKSTYSMRRVIAFVTPTG